MEILYGLIGWIVGLFLWSSILGSLFATLPLVMKLKKSGAIKRIKWAQIVLSVVFAVAVLGLSAIFLKPFFNGALVAGIFILFRLRRLKDEAIDNIKSEYPELSHLKNR